MEDTTDKEKRGFATSVLDNHERLMMYAQSNEDVRFFLSPPIPTSLLVPYSCIVS